MDYSFLKLYNSIDEALNDDLFKDRQLSYYIPVQLSPNEAYSQKTNYEGGISFQNNFTIEIVDSCESVLKDITNNVFIEEFTDAVGLNQCKIEIININEDFYGRAVFIRFTNNVGNDVYYTRPIKITNKDIEKTFRFDYKDNSNSVGLSYENSNFEQSIRLNCKFKDFNNKSDVSDYRQASTGLTISGLEKMSLAQDFMSEQMDTFTFIRLQKLLFHNIIYMDGVRVTNKPILEQGGRIGQSNLMKSSFSAFKDYNDKKDYEYQIFAGLQLLNLYPQGNYTLSVINGNSIQLIFNADVSILNGNITIYDAADNSIVAIITQNDLEYIGGGEVKSLNTLDTIITENGTYYFTIDSGLFISEEFGLSFDGISDNTTWAFTVGVADYSVDDYSDDYFIDSSIFSFSGFDVAVNSNKWVVGENGLLTEVLAGEKPYTFENGYRQLLVEDEATNYMPNSNNFNSFIKRGLATTVQNLINIDGEQTAWSVSVGNKTVNDTYLFLNGISSTEPCFYFNKLNNVNGFFVISNPYNANYGEWKIDLSLLEPNTWVRISRNHNAVTIVNEFNVYSGNGGVHFYTININSVESFGVSNMQLSNGYSSYIPTNGSAVTRLADEITKTPPVGTTLITETINGVDNEITTIPALYQVPNGFIDKVIFT